MIADVQSLVRKVAAQCSCVEVIKQIDGTVYLRICWNLTASLSQGNAL